MRQARPNQRRVTRKEVARYAGVSEAVVSYVINEVPGRVSADTAARVREAVDVLHYRPDPNARALKTGSARLLGAIAPDTTNPFFAELTDALASAASKHGYDVLVANSRLDKDQEGRNIRSLVSRQVDALIIASLLSSAEQADLRINSTPRVLIAQPTEVPGVPVVGTDFVGGATEGVQHLIGHGHELIGLIVGASEQEDFVDPRQIGWTRALTAARLALGPVERTDFTRRGGYLAMRRLLAEPQRPTAVLVSSDMQAVGVLLAIHESGLSIPHDIAVVSFDGTSDSEFSWPQLTTLKQDNEAIAAAAVKAALRPDSVEHPVQLMPTELIIRNSCGCTPV